MVSAGNPFTVSVAAPDVTGGVHGDAEITQRYWLPLIEAVTPVRARLDEVAPLILVKAGTAAVLTCHWYVNGLPEALTLNVAVLPKQAPRLDGFTTPVTGLATVTGITVAPLTHGVGDIYTTE